MKAYHEKLSYDSDIPITISEVNNLNFLAHWHFDVEIIYILEGSLCMGINRESRVLNKGDIAICSSGGIHYYDSKDMNSKALLLIFRPEMVDSAWGWPEQCRFSKPFLDIKFLSETNIADVIGKILNSMKSIMVEQSHKTDVSKLFIKSSLFDICGNILKYFPSEPIEKKKEYRKFSYIKTMQEVLNYLDLNYMHEITLPVAAEKANLSQFHFSRLFKEIAGMNFVVYLNSIRIDKAEEKLKNSSIPIVDIAFECGFGSLRTFNRAFKSIKGCVPSALRLG